MRMEDVLLKPRPAADARHALKVMLGLAVAGLLLSVYLAADHFFPTQHTLCDWNSVISCTAISHSSFSQFLNVPVAVMGLLWFAVLVTLVGFTLVNVENARATSLALYAWSAFGVLFVFYLVAAEFIVGAICPFCTAIHVINFALLFYARRQFAPWSGRGFPSLWFLFDHLALWGLGIGVLFIIPIIFFNLITPVEALQRLPNEQIFSLTRCLREKNIKMFGLDSCGACIQQKNIFGAELFKKEVDYTDCGSHADLCSAFSIKGYPTWIKLDAEGKEVARAAGVHGIIRLAEFAECSLSPKTADSA